MELNNLSNATHSPAASENRKLHIVAVRTGRRWNEVGIAKYTDSVSPDQQRLFAGSVHVQRSKTMVGTSDVCTKLTKNLIELSGMIKVLENQKLLISWLIKWA